jgi:hypothetical protein
MGSYFSNEVTEDDVQFTEEAEVIPRTADKRREEVERDVLYMVPDFEYMRPIGLSDKASNAALILRERLNIVLIGEPLVVCCLCSIAC